MGLSRLRVLFLLLVALRDEGCSASFNLTLLHTNDVHARYDEINEFGSRCPEGTQECFGGVARMMTKVREIRNSMKNILFLNAGDYYQGSMYYSIHKWNITADFMNRLQYDVMALGNHEFDDGIPGLVPFLNEVKFVVLACNIDASEEPSVRDKIKPSVVIKVGTEKIGIIGYTTPDTPEIANIGKLQFSDEVACIQKEAKKMQSAGINKIIALGHSGFPMDKEIAEEVQGIDIVIGGHTNTFTYTGTPPSNDEPVAPYPLVIKQKDGARVLVLEDFAFGKYLGFLQVAFDDDGNVQSWNGNPILLDNTIGKDPETVQALDPYKKVVKEKGHQVVGQTLVDLIGDRRVCRMKECNLGNMLSDATARFYRGKPSEGKWSTLTASVWNAGGIRSSVVSKNDTVNITLEDILTIAPFGNTIDVVEMYGSDILLMMEHSVSDYDPDGLEPSGGFLQISGMKVEYDIRKKVGKRVTNLLVKCNDCRVPIYEHVNETKTYSVAIPTFMVEGGNGYNLISKNAVKIHNRGDLDADIVMKYLEKMSPVSPGLEGRIIFISDGNSGSSPKIHYSLLLSFVLIAITYSMKL